MNLIRSWFQKRQWKKQNEINKIAMEIGNFYLEQVRREKLHAVETEEDYNETTRRIAQLRITSIDMKRGNIIITLCRPGLIIGRKGGNIEALKDHLERKLGVFSFDDIEIKENTTLDYIYPMSPSMVEHAITGD